MNDADLIVVGGGIVGTSTALFAAREGLEVLLLERNSIGSGASGAAAGLLPAPDFLDPSRPLEEQNPFAVLSEHAYRFYPDFIELVESLSETDTEFVETGSCRITTDPDRVPALKNYMTEMEKHGHRCTWMSGDELRDRYPFFNEHVTAGFRSEREARTNPRKLMQAIKQALDEIDVTVLEDTTVQSLSESNDQVTVDTTRGTSSADQLVMACGCWSASFSDELHLDLPVQPRKGQMIRLSYEIAPDAPSIHVGDRYLIPRRNQQLDVGATTEDTGFDCSLTDRARRELLRSARSVLRNLSDGDVIRHWAGLRPYADVRGGPLLGPVPDSDRLYVGTGHYKTGILQGPYSGKLLAALVAGQKPADPHLDPFHPGRTDPD